MKTMVNNLILMMVISIALWGSELGDLAKTMKAGEWKEFQTNNFSWEFDAEDVNGQINYAAPSMSWSDNVFWFPENEEIFYLGAGHLVAYGFKRYRASDNTWFQTTDVPACMKKYGYDGCFDHAYDQGARDLENGIFYFNPFMGSLYAIDIHTAAFTALTLPNTIVDGRAKAMEYFPPLKSLVFVIGGTVTMYNTVTKKGIPVATGLTMGGYHNAAVYSAKARKLFFGGGNGSNDFYMMDSSLNIVKMPDAPAAFTVSSQTLTTDPVTGHLLFLSGNKLYVFNPESTAWQNGPSAPFSGHALGTPIDNHGVTLFAVTGNTVYRIFLYKHMGSTEKETTKINREDRLKVQVNPNPFTSRTRIRINGQKGLAIISIYNMQGRLMTIFESKGQGTITWDAGKLKSGIYLIKIRSGGAVITKQVSIIR